MILLIMLTALAGEPAETVAKVWTSDFRRPIGPLPRPDQIDAPPLHSRLDAIALSVQYTSWSTPQTIAPLRQEETIDGQQKSGELYSSQDLYKMMA